MKSNWRTTGDIACSANLPIHRVNYIARTRGIQADKWIGHTRVFGPEAVAKIETEISKLRKTGI